MNSATVFCIFASILATLSATISASIMWTVYVPANQKLNRMEKVNCTLTNVYCDIGPCCDPITGVITKTSCEGKYSWTSGRLYLALSFFYSGNKYSGHSRQVDATCPNAAVFDCRPAQKRVYNSWLHEVKTCYVDPKELSNTIELNLDEIEYDASKETSSYHWAMVSFGFFCFFFASCLVTFIASSTIEKKRNLARQAAQEIESFDQNCQSDQNGQFNQLEQLKGLKSIIFIE
jgi:hypothetical protein